MKKRKSKKIYRNSLIAPLFLIVCLLGLVINLFMPDKAFSAAENRTLASFPGLSLQGLSDGSTQQQIDTWYSDQLAGRETDFHVSYLLRKLFGQREINDVFLGWGALLGQSSEAKENTPEMNVMMINELAKKTELPVTVLIAPNAATIQSQKLPWMAPADSQNKQLDAIYQRLDDKIGQADVRGSFKDHAKDYIYYKTDHHWTTYGAGLAWEAFEKSRAENVNLEDWDTMQVSSSFTGTLAGKTGSVGLADDIFIAVGKENPDYIVTWADGSKTTSIYNQAALDQRDQYQLFLGANQSIVHIDTTNANNKNLLLFKDSYANSLIQYMLPEYQSITIIDPRYFYEDLASIFSVYSISEIAFVYSCDTFVSDGTLQDVIAPYISGADQNGQDNPDTLVDPNNPDNPDGSDQDQNTDAQNTDTQNTDDLSDDSQGTDTDQTAQSEQRDQTSTDDNSSADTKPDTDDDSGA